MNDIIAEHWGYKTGSNGKGWRRRYIVLTKNQFSYHKAPNKPVIKAIDVRNIKNISGTIQGPKKQLLQYGFNVECRDRTYKMCAEDEHAWRAWVELLDNYKIDSRGQLVNINEKQLKQMKSVKSKEILLDDEDIAMFGSEDDFEDEDEYVVERNGHKDSETVQHDTPIKQKDTWIKVGTNKMTEERDEDIELFEDSEEEEEDVDEEEINDEELDDINTNSEIQTSVTSPSKKSESTPASELKNGTVPSIDSTKLSAKVADGKVKSPRRSLTRTFSKLRRNLKTEEYDDDDDEDEEDLYTSTGKNDEQSTIIEDGLDSDEEFAFMDDNFEDEADTDEEAAQDDGTDNPEEEAEQEKFIQDMETGQYFALEDDEDAAQQLEKKLLFPDDLKLIMNEHSTIIDGEKREKGKLKLTQNDHRKMSSSMWYDNFCSKMGIAHESRQCVFSDVGYKVNEKQRRRSRLIIIMLSGVILAVRNEHGDGIDKYESKKFILWKDLQFVIHNSEQRQETKVGLIIPSMKRDIMLDFTSTSRKLEFINHIHDVYWAEMNRELKPMEVVDIFMFIRNTPGDKVKKPIPMNEDQKLISHPCDYYKLADESKWRDRLRKFGDRNVYFSEIVEKVKVTKKIRRKMKRMFIITDKAVYTARLDTIVSRRVPLEDLNIMMIEERNKKSFLLKIDEEGDINQRIPSYDLYVKFRTSTDVAKRRKNVQELLQQLASNIMIEYGRNVKRTYGQLKKPEKYRQWLRDRVNPKHVKKQLHKAIVSKDEGILQKAVDTATRIDLEDDPYYRVAQQELTRIRDAARIRKEFQQAYQIQDMRAMKILLEQADKLKTHMTLFLRASRPKYFILANEKILCLKMETSIQSEDINSIMNIFEIAKNAGLNDQVQKYQIKYDKMLQTDYNRSMIDDMIKNRDRDGLRLLLQSASALEIEKEDMFTKAKASIVTFKEEDFERKRLEAAIHEGSKLGDKQLIENALKESLAKFPNLESLGDVENARNAITAIDSRSQNKDQLLKAIENQSKRKLRRLIEKCKTDPFLDPLTEKAANLLEQLQHAEDENKRLDIVRSLKDEFKTVFSSFKGGRQGDIKMLKRLVEKSRKHRELGSQVKSAQVLINNIQEREQESIRKKHLPADNVDMGVTLIDICLFEAVRHANIFEQTGVDCFHSDKHTALEEAIELEQQLRIAIANEDIDTIQDFLEEYENNPELEELITEANDALDRYEYNKYLSEKLDELVQYADRELLSQFISENKEVMTPELVKQARLAWKQIWDREQYIEELKTKIKKAIYDRRRAQLVDLIAEGESVKKDAELSSLIEEAYDEIEDYDMVVPSNMTHHLVALLKDSIIKLLKSYKPDENQKVDGTIEYYEVTLTNPLGQNIVQAINNIFNAKTKRGWWAERTTWDIFKNLKHHIVQNAINEFESFDAIKTLPSQNYQLAASLLFVQYMLDRGYFKYCVQELISNRSYLSECYESQSLLHNQSHVDNFIGVISLLDQFKFNYGFQSDNIEAATQLTADFIISKPINDVRDAIQQIVSYFYMNSASDNLSDLGDDTKSIEIGLLVRDKLARFLLESFEHGFKSGLILSNYVWNMFEAIADTKKQCAMDLGGVNLPHAIEQANETIVNKAKKGTPVKEISKLKFTSFVCYALNHHELADFILSIVTSSMMLDYYEPNAVLTRKNIQSDLVSLLQKLDALPFKLSLAPSLE